MSINQIPKLRHDHVDLEYLSSLQYTISVELLASQFSDLFKQCYWQKFKLADFSTVWRETHACSINGSITAQVNLAIFTRFTKLPNLNHSQ